jgi:hypothetical protein
MPNTSSPNEDPAGYLHITTPDSIPQNATVINYDRIDSQIIVQGLRKIGDSTEYKQNITKKQLDRTHQELSQYEYHQSRKTKFGSGWFIEYNNTVYTINVVAYSELL